MRRERTEKTKQYLICCRRPKCTAKLSILIKDPIKTERTTSRYTFSPNVTEEMFMNTENYDTAIMFRKRPKKTVEKFDKINEILSEFDTLQPDLQISSLCSTLERLGSL